VSDDTPQRGQQVQAEGWRIRGYEPSLPGARPLPPDARNGTPPNTRGAGEAQVGQGAGASRCAIGRMASKGPQLAQA
jgi:hypothetical protein